MAKVPYKVSKAWQFGKDLVMEIETLSEHLVAAGETQLLQRLRLASVRIPKHLADSLQQSVEAERDRCYSQAHTAATELEAHLAMLSELELINSKTMKRWQRQAATISYQLAGLLPQAQPAIIAEAMATEETHGTIDNRPQERDRLPVRRAAVPRGRLQAKGDGARRINRQRSYQEPRRRQSPRENIQG